LRNSSVIVGMRPLAESERTYFEPWFGVDFSQVRLHSDTPAAENHCRNLFVLISSSGFGMIDGLMYQIYQSNEDFWRLE